MTLKQALLIVATATLAVGQRPFFAGSRPIGYPDVITTTAAATDDLGNRFGEDNSTSASTIPTTTQRLPIEANGDKDLVDRLSKLPIDKQPFWFINWQAYEANRKKPQTYPIRPSSFAQPISTGFDSNTGFNNNFNTGGSQPSLGNRNEQNEPTALNPGSDNRNVNPAVDNINAGTVGVTGLGNRNGESDVTNTARPGPLIQSISPVKPDADKIPTNQISNLGNRNGDGANIVEPTEFLQPPVNTAAFASYSGSQLSDNSFGNRFGSENSGLPTTTFNPSLNTQPSRPFYPGHPGGQFGSNIVENRYPGPQYFGSNAGVNSYPGGQYLGSSFGGNRFTDVGQYGPDSGSNFGGVPYPLWTNQYPQSYYGNQFAYDGSNFGRLTRNFEDDDSSISNLNRFKRDVENMPNGKKPIKTLVDSKQDSPYDIIRAFQQKAGDTIHDTLEILRPRGKKPSKEQIEKNLQDVIQILDDVNDVYAKYDEVDPEDIPSSGPHKESAEEEAIRLEMCEKKDKLTALLSRAPIKHVKCINPKNSKS